jgi:preprotein translocase subunit Sss1
MRDADARKQAIWFGWLGVVGFVVGVIAGVLQ